MNIGDVLSLYDRDERQDTEEMGMRREVAPGVVRLVDTQGTQSAIVYSELDETTADAVIEREIRHFTGLGHVLEWKLFGHDRPQGLHQRLVDRGFAAEERESVMVLDLGQVPPALLRPVPATVRRIRTPAELKDVTKVREAVWPGQHPWLEERIAYILRTDPQRMSVYAVYDGDEPVSAGRIHFPAMSRFASIWGGATLPDRRGRGFYTALLAARVQEAIGRQVRYLTIDAGAMSRPIVEKLGFREITWAQAHVYASDGRV